MRRLDRRAGRLGGGLLRILLVLAICPDTRDAIGADPVLDLGSEPFFETAPTELCDGLDNDGDGEIDEPEICWSDCAEGQSACFFGTRVCTAPPCCQCGVGAGQEYATPCEAISYGCEIICLGPGTYSVAGVCDIPWGTQLISLEGSDITTFVGDVVGEYIWVQGMTVIGDLYSVGRCAMFIDNVVHGSVEIAIAGECDSGIGLVAFNTVDRSISIAGFSFVWNNVAAGIGKGGRTPHFEALGNTLFENGLSVRGGGLLQDNIIFNAPVGIHAESGSIGLRADIIGNQILGAGTGVEIVDEMSGPHVAIASNLILGSRDYGIDYQSGVGSVISDNLIVGRMPQSGETSTGVGIRLMSSATLVGNTLVGGATGLRVGATWAQSADDVVVRLDSNIIGPTSGAGVDLVGMGTVIAMRNDVYGNAPDWRGLEDPSGTNGNISLDPRFRDPAADDWAIDPSSPCIDAGSATGASTDLAGHRRVLDGDMNGTAVQDMGAYEAAPEVLDLRVFTGPLRLEWPPNPHASSGFNLYSGRLSEIASRGLSGLTTEACSFGGTSYSIEGSSPPGDGMVYLVVPRGLTSGSPGTDSQGHPRVLSELCP